MKKFLALFLAIIIAITLVSCLDQKDTPTPAPDGGDASTTTTTTTAKDYTPKKLGSVSASDANYGAPISAYFDSINEIQDFIKAANGTEEEFKTYRDNNKKIDFVTNQKVAQAMAHNLDIINLPSVSFEITKDNFGADYSLSYNMFDILYKVGDVRYRFVYCFNETTAPSTEMPVYKENVTLGDILFDLYANLDGPALFGFYNDHEILVQVMIYTENFENIDLTQFKMSPVDSIK